jgi:hypothetical protein
LLGLVLMLIVAMLVQTPIPTRPTAETTETAGFYEEILRADDLSIHLQISPNRVGNNRYVTHLYHSDGSPIGDVQLVRLFFVHREAELGQASLDLAAQGGDLFAGEGAYQNRAGLWDLSVYVRRRGLDDALAEITVDMPAPAGGAPADRSPWQNPITTLPAGIVIGGVLVSLLLTPMIWRRVARS